MAKMRVKLWYEGELIHEPIISRLANEFGIVANIRRANVEDDTGWIVTELEGEESQLTKATDWLTQIGVSIEPVAELE